ncbi:MULTISPECIES: NIPSNAP family protein [Streptomyces]|uniref:NIPSNAP family protein n=1 Tax=Streptomyces TaxID=1883 RepID=UPI000A859F73|nr:NIPSNAP family protein [Streptomyces sp. XY511]
MPSTDPVRHLAVVELRQYTLRPGRRDDLIELFDRELIETQEETGMAVLGQFRDLDDPDRFVWLRGFPDMAARHDALTAFYGGTAWGRHGPGRTPPWPTPTTSCSCGP